MVVLMLFDTGVRGRVSNTWVLARLSEHEIDYGKIRLYSELSIVQQINSHNKTTFILLVWMILIVSKCHDFVFSFLYAGLKQNIQLKKLPP